MAGGPRSETRGLPRARKGPCVEGSQQSADLTGRWARRSGVVPPGQAEHLAGQSERRMCEADQSGDAILTHQPVPIWIPRLHRNEPTRSQGGNSVKSSGRVVSTKAPRCPAGPAGSWSADGHLSEAPALSARPRTEGLFTLDGWWQTFAGRSAPAGGPCFSMFTAFHAPPRRRTDLEAGGNLTCARVDPAPRSAFLTLHSSSRTGAFRSYAFTPPTWMWPWVVIFFSAVHLARC